MREWALLALALAACGGEAKRGDDEPTPVPFSGTLDDYARSNMLFDAGCPYLRGKLLVFDGAAVDPVSGLLPRELVATAPADVGTVAITSWTVTSLYEFKDGATSNRQDVEVFVFDHKLGIQVGWSRFTGEDPPRSKKGAGSVFGARPYAQLAAYLTGLPRKPIDAPEPPPPTAHIEVEVSDGCADCPYRVRSAGPALAAARAALEKAVAHHRAAPSPDLRLRLVVPLELFHPDNVRSRVSCEAQATLHAGAEPRQLPELEATVAAGGKVAAAIATCVGQLSAKLVPEVDAAVARAIAGEVDRRRRSCAP